jgi:hypothetical protein
MACTGVPKSETSSLRRRVSGRVDLVVEFLRSTLPETLLLQVDTDLGAGQADDDAAGAVRAAAEVDVAQRQLLDVLAVREMHGLRRRRRGRRRGGAGRLVERDQQHLALQLGSVVGRLLEVQHHARALAGARDVHAAHIGGVDLHGGATHAIADVGQVDRHARRRLDHESGGSRGQRLAELDADHFAGRLLVAADRTDQVLGPGKPRQRQAERQQQPAHSPTPHLA